MALVKQGSRVDYNYKEIYIDSASELDDIDTTTCCPGSIVYVVNGGAVYMLSNAKKWIAQ